MYTNLNSDKPLSAQPPALKVQLFHHQLTIIYAMMQIESTGEISEIKDGDVATSKVTTKFGILCDRVGAGKSNMILGFIDYVKNMIPQVMTKTKGCKYFSIVDTTAPTVDVIRTSLVIVPHSIANQWVGFLANTNLKYLIINKSKDVHDVVSSITKKPSRFARQPPVAVVSDDDSEDVSFDDSSDEFDSDSDDEPVPKPQVGFRGTACVGKTRAKIAIPRKPTKAPNPFRPSRRQPTHVINTVPASSLDKLTSLISALPSLFQSTVVSANTTINSVPIETASIISNNDNSIPIATTAATTTPKIMFKSAEEFLNQYDVVLLNTNRYDVFNSIFSDVTWARVIIDEADSIKMHRNLKPKYNFMWFVTATPRGLYNTSNHIVHSYIQSLRDFSSLDIMTFCVNNDAKYITESYELPKLKQYTITSRVNNIVKQLGEFLPNSIIGLINAGNINEAAKQLNCNLNSDGNICDALKSLHVTNLAKEVKELKRLETNLDDPEPNQDIALIKANITKQKNKINSLETKIQAIEEKIASIKSESCCICYDNINAPTIVKCCNNLFCFSCLIESLKYRQFCPMCRTPMDHKSYYVVDENKSTSSTSSTVNQNLIELSKKDILKELLVQLYKSNPKTRVLLFSDYAKTFENVASVFDDLKLTRNTISGTPDRINKMITGFENNLINVLMLDTHHYGSGLNLQMADVIILYHRMDASVETQVIGRAHRLGRTTSLKVFFISSDNEGKDKPVALATNLLNTDELLAAIVD